ncbi:MAG TPA: helix-turn-helix domain-containing protein [Spirillospora sp.]|nr:helix-turn-helix domain-containing protein [Spirillospora sp.]
MINDLSFPDDSRPTRSDALKNRALLLETAQRLFAEQGLENVSMSAIAEAAGVGKGTLYRHFKNKADLAYELLDQDQRDLQTRALRRFQNQGSPLDDLRWFLEQIVRFVDRNEALLCVAAGKGATGLNIPAHRWWRQSIRGLLQRIQPQPAVDIDYFTDILYVMMDVRTLQFQKRTLGYDTQRIIDGLHSVVSLLAS